MTMIVFLNLAIKSKAVENSMLKIIVVNGPKCKYYFFFIKNLKDNGNNLFEKN
jgi:hypothetical protein